IIITIMVLDLHAPLGGSEKLITLWPILVSYVLSYFVIAIYWMNHHRVFHFVKEVDVAVLWSNILWLFVLSFVPFATAYMGANQMSPFSVAVYSAVAFSCAVASTILRLAIARHMGEDPRLHRLNVSARRHQLIALTVFAAGVPLAYLHPAISLTLFTLVGFDHFRLWREGRALKPSPSATISHR
ncbi:MAG TPA: TMEM175 family protein, partial [Methylocystis sp.]|nr:TMEM175 family protein [Methylocystis sp.]